MNRHPNNTPIEQTASADQQMPCPRCSKLHRAGPYVARPDLKQPAVNEIAYSAAGVPHCPADVDCDCGAKLRHSVPLFAVGPYGWHWRIL